MLSWRHAIKGLLRNAEVINYGLYSRRSWTAEETGLRLRVVKERERRREECSGGTRLEDAAEPCKVVGSCDICWETLMRSIEL
jgi:hypothetical protein